jgi:hypothetical protein
MKLINCNECGVVLNADKLKFETELYNDDGSIDETKAAYNQDTKNWEAFVTCPCCQSNVFTS